MPTMRATATRGWGSMEVVAVEEPGAPGPGEVLLRPDVVGLCGSDFHYFLGDIGTIDDPASLYPRIQGHEVAAIALLQGSWTLSTTGSEGGPVELASRTAEVVRRQPDGSWLYVDDHAFGSDG